MEGEQRPVAGGARVWPEPRAMRAAWGYTHHFRTTDSIMLDDARHFVGRETRGGADANRDPLEEVDRFASSSTWR